MGLVRQEVENIYCNTRKHGRKVTPPSGEDAGSRNVMDMESVENSDQNVVTQAALSIVSIPFPMAPGISGKVMEG